MELDDILDASAEALAAELARVEAQLAALSAEAPERVRLARTRKWVALELSDRAAAAAAAAAAAGAGGAALTQQPPAASPPAAAPLALAPAEAHTDDASPAAAASAAASDAGVPAAADSPAAAPPTAAEAAEAAARRRAAVAQLARQRFQAERGVARRAAAALAGKPLPAPPPPERRATPAAEPPSAKKAAKPAAKPAAKAAKPATPPAPPPAAAPQSAATASADDASAAAPVPPASTSPRPSTASSAARRSSGGSAAADPAAAQAAEQWMSRQWPRLSVTRPPGGEEAPPQPEAAPEAALLAQAVPSAGGAEPAESDAEAADVALFAYAARDDGDERRSDGGSSDSEPDAEPGADASFDAAASDAFPKAPSDVEDSDSDAEPVDADPADSELEAAPASDAHLAIEEPPEALPEDAAVSDAEPIEADGADPATASDDDEDDDAAAATPEAAAAPVTATPPRATPPAAGRRTPGRRAQTASGPGKRGASAAASAAVVGTDYGALYSCFEEVFTAFARAPGAPPAARRADARAVTDLYRLTAAAAEAWCAGRNGDDDDGGPSPGAAAAAAMRAFWPSAAPAARDDASSGAASRRVRFYRCPCEAHAEVSSIVARALGDADAVGEWRLEESGPGDAPGLAGLYNLLWTWSSAHRPARPGELLTWQRCNHFAGIKALTRKDLLARHLERARRTRGAAFDLCPRTFQLPGEYVAFVDAFTKAAEEAEGGRAPLWIMKPVGLSRGRGIFLVSDLGDVAYGEAHVVQRYIEKPLLVDGHKFDLRLYVLVTSFAPVEAFLYSEGFARFSSERYSLADARNLRVHLTNYAVQKVGLTPGAAVAAPAPLAGLSAAAAGGSKCSLAHLWGVLRARRVDVAALWARIGDVVRRSLFAVHDVIGHQPNAFELLGYDIMVDAALKPWLIEVNSSPSLETDHPVDEAIKTRLVRDVAALLDPPAFDRAALAAVLRRRAAGGRAAPRGSDGTMGMGTLAEERAALNADLNAILGGVLPRRTGEPPAAPGLFARIVPSPEWDALLGARGGAKDSGGAPAKGGRPPRGS